jgi:hypothetical protein
MLCSPLKVNWCFRGDIFLQNIAWLSTDYIKKTKEDKTLDDDKSENVNQSVSGSFLCYRQSLFGLAAGPRDVRT